MKNVIKIKDVAKLYGNKIALANVSIEIETGKIIGLLGPNGSGKTTLFKILLHIIRPNNGEALINNEKINYLTRRYISYMPDRDFLYAYMTVQDAINYYADMFEDFNLDKSKKLCERLGLNPEDTIKKLSKGNSEKVNLMLTLSRDTEIYLLDEPLGSLDPVIKNEMLIVIKECKSENNCILIATHLIKDTEEILDAVIFLKNGTIELFEDTEMIISSGKTIEERYLEVFRNV